MTHVSAFLPELLQLLPTAPTIFVPHELHDWAKELSDDVITHCVPEGSLKLAFTQQVTARWHSRKSDIVLSVMNTGPIGLSATHIIWACNVSHFVPSKAITGRLQNWTVLKAMNCCDLCIFPTKSAQQMAVTAGFRNSAAIIYHPMRSLNAHWKKPGNSDKLKIFVPASNNAHKNLTLLPEVSGVLTERGADHQINLTIDPPMADDGLWTSPSINFVGRYKSEQLEELASKHDVALIPSLLESYSYSLAELEEIGMPVAASNIPAHTEIARTASLFDPNSAVKAVDAIYEATKPATHTITTSKGKHQPHDYASKIFLLIKELAYKNKKT